MQTEQFYQSLFNRDKTEDFEPDTDAIIPQTTLYDMPIRPQRTPTEKHVTVFGFSQSNRTNILAEVSKLVEIVKKEEGRNYVKIWAEDSLELEKVLKLNHKVINGEIVGVYRNNFGIINSNDIYVKKKGLFQIIKEYLFGE